MEVIFLSKPGPDFTTTLEMTISQMGRVTEEVYFNHVILRTYNGFVSLTDPRVTWEKDIDINVVPFYGKLVEIHENREEIVT